MEPTSDTAKGNSSHKKCSKRLRACLCRWLMVTLAACSFASWAGADTITLGGNVTQATLDGNGPAVNNPGLNSILDGDAFSVVLSFSGSITAPGTYSLTGLSFSDPSAGAIEAGFDSLSLVITANGGFDEFSLLGCLTTGSGCLFGNQLDANFKVPTGSLNSSGVAAIGLDQPHPLDLLEDDGVTDIHGNITSYSYKGTVVSVPEPSMPALLCCAAIGLAGIFKMKHKLGWLTQQ